MSGKGEDRGGRSHGHVGDGRTSGRGAGGPSNRNRQMGDMSSIIGMVKSISDREINTVIAPSAADRQSRASKLNPSAPSRDPFSYMIPGHAAWRFDSKIAKVLDPSKHAVVSNHYAIDEEKICRVMYRYAIHLYPYSGTKLSAEDDAPTIDIRKSVALILALQDKHPEWEIGRGVGLAYDGKASCYSTKCLPFKDLNEKGDPCHIEDISVKTVNEMDATTMIKYRIKISLVDQANYIGPNASYGIAKVLSALETSLLAFAKLQAVRDEPEWFLVGSQLFRSSSTKFALSPSYVALRGYKVGIKECLAGLVFVADMATSVFLTGGSIIDIIIYAGRFRDIKDLIRMSEAGLPPRLVQEIDSVISGSKIKLSYLGQYRKAKSLGPTANKATFFVNGKSISVAEYFAGMCANPDTKAKFRQVLPKGKLQYPNLPTINIGAASNQILIPAELVIVPSGQCRTNSMTGDMAAQLVKHSAIRPNDRFEFLQAPDSIVKVVQSDKIMKSFGLSSVSSTPLAISASILPQAKLRFASGNVSDPELSGKWNFLDKKFFAPASARVSAGVIPYCIVIVGSGPPPGPWEEKLKQFVRQFEADGDQLGCRIRMNKTPLTSSPSSVAEKFKMINDALGKAEMKFALVVLCGDYYGAVKLQADLLSLTTQCVKWRNIDHIPSGFTYNIMLKVNSKLGGINHTLISRSLTPGPQSSALVFQDPPASIGWMFDVPCMLVGMDVSHSERDTQTDSIAAIVASMDNKISQYSAYVASQKAGQEMVGCLEDGMNELLSAFRKRNGSMPKHIIVYRDGVSDGQLDHVVAYEVPALKGAIALLGYEVEKIKIVVIVCKKGHNTRIVYEERGKDGPTFINPCPGLCVDALNHTSRNPSIVSATFNEFYINSQVAIQGTSKPCKYALVYDEIGCKISELELLTYWTTYMYCRANKTISYAAPAYYAHWASKRGRYLHTAGANEEMLKKISMNWTGLDNPMFFV